MSEKNEKEIDANSKEEIKDEAKNTFDDVKETIKNVKFQSDAKETTNFVSKIFQDPLGILKRASSNKNNEFLKHAILLVCLWVVATLITGVYYVASNKFMAVGTRFLNVLKDLLEPIIGLIAISLIVLLNQKDSKKSLTTTFTTVTVASIPLILLSVIEILRLFSAQFEYILTPLSYFATAVTIVFMYFATKDLAGEEESSKFIRKFIGIEFAYFICYFIFQFLGMYLPIL